MVTWLARHGDTHPGVEIHALGSFTGDALVLNELGQSRFSASVVLLFDEWPDDAVKGFIEFRLLGFGSRGVRELLHPSVVVVLQELGEGLEVVSGATFFVTSRGKHLTLSIHQKDGGEALDIKLLSQGIILGLDRRVLLFTARVIQFDEDKILSGDFEGLLVEDFLLQTDAPAAPITTREVDEDCLFFLGGDGLGLVEIGQPGDFGVGRSSGNQSDDGEQEAGQIHGEGINSEAYP